MGSCDTSRVTVTLGNSLGSPSTVRNDTSTGVLILQPNYHSLKGRRLRAENIGWRPGLTILSLGVWRDLNKEPTKNTKDLWNPRDTRTNRPVYGSGGLSSWRPGLLRLSVSLTYVLKEVSDLEEGRPVRIIRDTGVDLDRVDLRRKLSRSSQYVRGRKSRGVCPTSGRFSDHTSLCL